MPQRRACIPACAPAFVFFLLLQAMSPAWADLYLMQKEQHLEKSGGNDAKKSDGIIRTWAAEGRLRKDHGDPVTFIHISRLDRRPGEIVTYLINLGEGAFGNTYWTTCRPAAPTPAATVPEDEGSEPAVENTPGRKGPRDSRETLTVTDTGETKRINNFLCRKYLLKERLTLTELSSEIWVTTEILPVLERHGLVWGVRMGRFDPDLRLREVSNGPTDEMRLIRGFPVLIIETEWNQYVHYERRLELLEFKESPIPPEQFELPGGLVKKYRGAMAHPPECED